MLKSGPPRFVMDTRWKPALEMAPNCPRCNSSNTKFSYYNNYSITQPRYFCKGCRRYWTKGGSLRNVPVGGGCRKNRRGKSVRAAGSLSPGCPVTDSDRDVSELIGNSDRSERGNLAEDNNGPNIDLDVVYAKYLNQDNLFHTEQDSEFVVLEIPNQFESCFDLPTSQDQFLLQNNTVRCSDFSSFDPQSENYVGEPNQFFLGGLEANQNQDEQHRIEQPMSSDLISNIGLQPFPNGVLQDIFMSNPNCSSINSWQLPQQPLFEADNPPISPNFSDLFS